MIFDAISGLGSAALGYLTRKIEIRAHAAEQAATLRAASVQARLEAARADKAAIAQWEIASITNSGWKDEYWTLALSVPALVCFIPGAAPFVAAGFAALDACPQWYRYLLMVAVTSAFGVRPAIDWFTRRWGR